MSRCGALTERKSSQHALIVRRVAGVSALDQPDVRRVHDVADQSERLQRRAVGLELYLNAALTVRRRHRARTQGVASRLLPCPSTTLRMLPAPEIAAGAVDVHHAGEPRGRLGAVASEQGNRVAPKGRGCARLKFKGAAGRCAVESGDEAVVSRPQRADEGFSCVRAQHDGEPQISVGRGCVTAAGDGLKNGIAVGIAVGVRGERNGVLLAGGDPAIARHQHTGDEVRLVAGRSRDLKDIRSVGEGGTRGRDDDVDRRGFCLVGDRGGRDGHAAAGGDGGRSGIRGG